MPQENGVRIRSGWVTFLPLLLIACSTATIGFDQERIEGALLYTLLTCVF